MEPCWTFRWTREGLFHSHYHDPTSVPWWRQGDLEQREPWVKWALYNQHKACVYLSRDGILISALLSVWSLHFRVIVERWKKKKKVRTQYTHFVYYFPSLVKSRQEQWVTFVEYLQRVQETPDKWQELCAGRTKLHHLKHPASDLYWSGIQSIDILPFEEVCPKLREPGPEWVRHLVSVPLNASSLCCLPLSLPTA